MALSTAEAEYMALSEVVKEITWLRRVLNQLGYPQESPTMVKEDNQSCISWVPGETSTIRAKHFGLKYHYSKDLYEKGEVKLQYCPSEKMLADITTKPLASSKLGTLRSALGVFLFSLES